MLLRAPAGCTGFSHEGRAYHIGADGVIEVDDHLAPLFLAHGFVPCVGERAREAPRRTDEPDIGALTRNELFAFLKERGVRVRPPITNAALREAAWQAAEG